MLREHHTGGNYLQFYNPSSSSVKVRLYYGSDPGDEGDYVLETQIECSTDRGSTWVEYMSGDDIPLEQYDSVMFKCASGSENWDHCEGADYKKPFGHFWTSDACECSGDVMTLLDDDRSKSSVPDMAFKGLFSNVKITTAPEISATEIGEYSCEDMFYQCANLTTGPAVLLPASLAESCYARMFYGCQLLVSVPELNFDETAPRCCEAMFADCINIEEVSLLPTDLTAECFKEMFMGCSKLNRIETRFSVWPEYRQQYHTSDDDIREDATLNWTRGVAPMGTFVRTILLPLYINDKPTSGNDMYTGEVYNIDAVNNVVYDTSAMFHFDPWVGEGCYNITEVPPSVVKYRTVTQKQERMTVTFDILSSRALTRDSERTVIEDQELSQFAEEQFGGAAGHLDPSHAGKLDITALFKEIIDAEGDSAGTFIGNYDYLTPDHDVIIDWGDGTQRTVIPRLCFVDSMQRFVPGNYPVSSIIGGIITHEYDTYSGSHIISVWSDDMKATDTFFSTIGTGYNADDKRFKGVMVPLHAGRGSNIEALLTPLLPIYAGAWGTLTHNKWNQYPPLAGMFYNNHDLTSVPDGFDEELALGNLPSTVMSSAFCKNGENLNHPFGAAYMFYGCNKLQNAPALESMNLRYDLSHSDGSVQRIDGVKKNNSVLECFMKGCYNVKKVRLKIDSNDLAPFELASAFDMTDAPQGTISSLNEIDFRSSIFKQWPSYPSDIYRDDCWGTINWTRDVKGEYTKSGTLSSLFSEITDTKSDAQLNDYEGAHEWNPWSEDGPSDDEYLTFTNPTQSNKTIILKNQRKMFASLVNGNRHLDFKADRTVTLERECHIHLLRYRVKNQGADWTHQTPWLDITDDTLSGTTIHAGEYAPSQLYSNSNYDFIWSITIGPGQSVQVVGVPASMMRVYPQQETVSGTTRVYPCLVPSGDMNKKSWRFDDTYYPNSAAYWYDCPFGTPTSGSGTCYLTLGSTVGGSTITTNIYDAAYYSGSPQTTVPYIAINANGDQMSGLPEYWVDGSSLRFAKTTRMFTQISNKDFWYQFENCSDLEVTGFIDTFFDCLDYRSDMYYTPPYTFYRLFSGTGIVSAPKIFATVGPNRGEFSECFKNCTSLAAPAKMNLSAQKAVPRMGPAKTIRFNYIAGPTVPFMLSPSFGSTGSGAPTTASLLFTSSIHPTGYCDTECLWSDHHSGAFEEAYKGCTSLVWPTRSPVSGITYPEQMCIGFNRGSGRLYNSNVNAFESAFEGCTSIGTFGLITYSKDGLLFDPEENANFQHQPFKNMFKDCTTSSDYLWDCFYTNASLKKYSWWGGNDGVKDCWQGGHPTKYWLGGDTNIAKLETNCCKPPQSGHLVPPINVWTDSSRGGTCSNAAWGNAYTDHHLTDPDFQELPNQGQNYNKVWVRWNHALSTNPYLLTWRTNENNLQMTLDDIQ